MKYPKIHSIWKRQGWYLDEGKKNNPEYQSGRQSFIEGDWAVPEFSNIKRWRCHEKIDGTNVRIEFFTNSTPGDLSPLCSSIQFKGRTDEASLPKKLDNYLRGHFTHDLLEKVFVDREKTELQTITLFGEGYGPGIQKGGGNYRGNQGFILFDVVIGKWWMEQDTVKEMAEKLGVPYAPLIGIMTTEEILAYIKSKPLSVCSERPQEMEGVIARPEQLLLLRDGSPLLMKVKCRDF